MAESHTQTFWEAAAESTWGTYLSDAERRVLMQALDLAPADGEAMEVGCEAGRWSRYLTDRRGAAICVDIDPVVLRRCAERLPQARCVLARPDEERLPAGDDEVAMLLVFEVPPVTSGRWFVAEAARVLKPGGILAFSYENPASVRALAHRAAARLDPGRTTAGGYYRGPPYRRLRRSLVRAGFEVIHQEGLAWAPFERVSNSPLVPAAVRVEKALGLRRLPAVSPWVLVIVRRL
jgi:SAM-dependent methyltransferase